MSEVTKIQSAIKRVREALKDRVYSKVAKTTGLHVNTVRNVANNDDQMFSLSTIAKLEKYLFGEKA